MIDLKGILNLTQSPVYSNLVTRSTGRAVRNRVEEELEKIDEEFDKHHELLDTFKHYDLAEKGVINRMLKDIKNQMSNFKDFQKSCDEMYKILDEEVKEIGKKKK